MVITVSCPSCSTSFPVDPAKVPRKGVNARCSVCGDIFRVEKPDEGAEGFGAPPQAPRPAAAPPPVPAPPPAPAPAPRPAATPPPVAPPLPAEESADLGGIDVVPPPAPEPEPPPQPAAASTSTGSTAPAGGTFRFGKRDPTDKAKRLARVLVSDMIMYNAERHRNALENDTLAQDFEDEIEKSWKEYVDQVGSDIAEGEGREFWRDALNDILAKGEKIF